MNNILNYKLKNLENYKIITLCGSTTFKKSFELLNMILTLNNKIVLLPGFYTHYDNINITEEQKKLLDILHKDKISMSDCIIIINDNNYIGESTNSEIIFATILKKPIFYLFNSYNTFNDDIIYL